MKKCYLKSPDEVMKLINQIADTDKKEFVTFAKDKNGYDVTILENADIRSYAKMLIGDARQRDSWGHAYNQLYILICLFSRRFIFFFMKSDCLERE